LTALDLSTDECAPLARVISPDRDPPDGSPPHERKTIHCEYTTAMEAQMRRLLGMRWEWEIRAWTPSGFSSKMASSYTCAATRQSVTASLPATAAVCKSNPLCRTGTVSVRRGGALLLLPPTAAYCCVARRQSPWERLAAIMSRSTVAAE
jgi:hypothetical protein